jgi:hypothetical protein
MIKPSQSITEPFETQKFDTGVATDADSLPTGVLVKNGADTLVAVTVANKATGSYTASCTIPKDATAGDSFSLRIEATVNSVSGKKTVWADRVDTVRLSDKPAVSLATADVSGNLPANALQWNTGALPTIGDATAANQTTLLNRLSAARAGYLDNLNVGGNVASQADVQGITQAQRVRVLPPSLMERPDSDSTAYRIWIYVYNEQHQAEDLDSAPTVTAENNAGTSR